MAAFVKKFLKKKQPPTRVFLTAAEFFFLPYFILSLIKPDHDHTEFSFREISLLPISTLHRRNRQFFHACEEYDGCAYATSSNKF